MSPTYRITRYNHPSQNWMEAVLALRAEFGESSPEPFVSFITRRLEDETMLLLLAWDGEQPVGYGLAFEVESDPAKPEWTRTGYISQFLVTESHRQKGVGAQLMEVIDAWFAERGLNKVLLNVNIDNPAGIRFWQKHGFEAYALRMKRVRQPKAKGPATEPIRLREVHDSDLPIFYEQQRDPVANELAGFPSRDLEPFMAHWAKIRADETNILRTILFEGQVAGNIVSFVMDGHQEVGYWLGREFWGRGLATRALEMFAAGIKIRPLYGYVIKDNLASQRVLQKCGFQPDGSVTEFSAARNTEVEFLIFRLD